MIQDDEKFKTLRDSLRSLPRVKAKPDFEARLMQRIREANDPVVHTAQKIKPASALQGWFANLFRPAFVPALGLTVVLLITVGVYFVFFSKMNDGLTENTQQFVSSTNQGDLIIYVKKDGDDISSNYPKEYSAVEPEDTRSGELFAPPVETPSDFMAKPDPTRTLAPELKPDRVSEEQKIEMQKSFDLDKDKGVDSKGERKSDNIIMKKESKKDSKIETKGEMKSETKRPEKKSSDEKKNIFFDDESDTNKEQENSPVPAPKKNGILSNDNVNQQTQEEPENRISRATKKDSTKNKSDSEAEEKNIEQQK